MNMTFDPFTRHRGTAASVATAVKQAVDSKPVERKPSPANPFNHHGAEPKDRPEPKQTQKPLPAQELLIWIRRCWNKSTISLRDIQVYGPNAIRDRKTAISHAETLARHGWLAEIKAHRRDRRLWKLPPAGATTLPED
jgi:hypothetical protein